MPQLGSEKNPVFINSKKRGKKLGLVGKFYNSERKKRFDENYDKIFNISKVN
tara:strand:- start:607 stop:762 length:156 start_codon:yes stop_codon:yes gene_type:complete